MKRDEFLSIMCSQKNGEGRTMFAIITLCLSDTILRLAMLHILTLAKKHTWVIVNTIAKYRGTL